MRGGENRIPIEKFSLAYIVQSADAEAYAHSENNIDKYTN